VVASEPPLFSEGMSTPFLETLAARPVDPDAPEDTAPLPEEKVHGVGRLLIGLGLVVVGVAVEWLFLAPLGDLDGIIKVPAVLAGVAIILSGLHLTFTAIWGPRFETGFWLSLFWVLGLTLAAVFAA
jgi:hypothetical protein